MLAALEADGARWGIVTNKPEHRAREIRRSQVGTPERGAGRRHSLPERKPHPLPLL